ncbi:YesL family protein [Paenibacillus protaetiae]|uniref:DUF624 domain-containing protein n=1 Tax=Paenibacillus protaetiae TaxID=2509456 RepID=A0A4P6F094_9BACL|nr:DUF624 domain-containing protein [Paenibacillus protaetiae]QAY66407.1 DUF624 domain-containing protein [Paenibacillus protaetiae]
MEPRGLMGGFYRISEWIMRLAVTNVLWIVCSIPFMFSAFVSLFAQDKNQLYSTLLVAAVTAPFTLFPATAAMFTVARKWVMGEADVPLLKTFFRGYKENYKQSMLGGLLYTVILVILLVDFVVYRNQINNIVSYIFVAFLVLVMISVFNFFSMIVHYHMKTFQLVKNALLITIGRPLRSISMVVMNGVVIFISTKFTFLIPFFAGSIIAYLSFWSFHLIYQKLQEQSEKAKENAGEEEEFPELTDSSSDHNKS